MNNVGTHPIILEAILGILVVNESFNVIIEDPCKFVTLTSTPTFTDMLMTRDLGTSLTQTLTIETDLNITPNFIDCPLTCSLVNPPAFASLSGTTVTLNSLQTTAADVDNSPHTIQMSCDSTNHPADVTDQTYQFDLTINHCVVNTMTIPTIGDVAFLINEPPLPVPFTAATWSDEACIY